jgi:hypothetical protein
MEISPQSERLVKFNQKGVREFLLCKDCENKLPTILAGVAAAESIYVIVDGVTDETSESIDKVFKSLPDAKGTIK